MKRPLPPTQCAATGVAFDAEQLPLRLVQGPDHRWHADVRNRWEGEGVWVLAQDAALQAFGQQRGLGAEAMTELRTRVTKALHDDALAWLPIVAKAGQLLTGFDTVHKALRAGDLAALLHAADAAADGMRKLAYPYPQLPRLQCFSGEAMSRALGKPHVVHAGVGFGGAGESFLRSCQRLAGFPDLHRV